MIIDNNKHNCAIIWQIILKKVAPATFLCPCFLGCCFLFGTYTYIYIKEAYRPRGVYLLLSNGPLTESSSVTSAFAVAVSWWWFISFTVGGNFLDVRVKLIFYKYLCPLPTSMYNWNHQHHNSVRDNFFFDFWWKY